MGFLRRLLGATVSQEVEFDAKWFTELRGDAAVEVVGESHYRETVERIRRAGPGSIPPGLPAPEPGFHKAILMREPGNKYDANAVAVRLFVNEGALSQVGHLSRENAAAYRPVFDFLHGAHVACDAALVAERHWGGESRSATGVVLHLGSPGELIAELWTAGHPLRPDHQWLGKIVTFTGFGQTSLAGVPLDRYAQVLLARKAGCEVLPRVTKKSQVVVASDPHEMTGNMLKARDYGLPIVSEVQFWQEVGVPPEALSRASGRWTQR